MPIPRYQIIKPHISKYPEPIIFQTGNRVRIRQQREDPQGKGNWTLCSVAGSEARWVPAQLIELSKDGTGRMKMDYISRELDTCVGDIVSGVRVLNGWRWCFRESDQATGWVPLENIRQIDY